MENKSIEEIAAMKKNFLNTSEVVAVFGISPATFRKKADDYSEKFPIERVGKVYEQ